MFSITNVNPQTLSAPDYGEDLLTLEYFFWKKRIHMTAIYVY